MKRESITRRIPLSAQLLLTCAALALSEPSRSQYSRRGVQVDAEDCADTVDKLRRVARDAAGTAEDFRSRKNRESLEEVQLALDEVESRLRKAMRECGMQPSPPPPFSAPLLKK